MSEFKIYKCIVCDKLFTCKKNIYYCKLCHKGFTTETSMYRHMRTTCKVKKQSDDEKNKIYQKLLVIEEIEERCNHLENENKKRVQLENEIRDIKNENDNLKRKVAYIETKDNNKVVNINRGIVNNLNQNIILVGYGKEDISKIDQNEILRVLNNGYNSAIKLTETVHFNPKYPEYHNIYISNIKDKYAMMFNGNSWTLTMKEELIDKIYDDKKNYIEENIDDFIASLPQSRKKALERWLDTDDNNNKIKEVKEQIKLLLYNKRNIPITTQSNMNYNKNDKDLNNQIEN